MSDNVIDKSSKNMIAPPSTVGRGKTISIENVLQDKLVHVGNASLYCGDSLAHYADWKKPDVIISDGAYGILGFVGDTSNHLGLPEWYEPHIKAWSAATADAATLWFWNSEIGWAAVHPILEKHGWRYVNCNIWNKGLGHIAGNINTKKIRRFPVVTEVCAHYVREVRIFGKTLQQWLRHEWDRTELKLTEANIACEVKDVAVRKYLDKGHLWYFPPRDAFVKLAHYANEKGNPDGRPYFSRDGKSSLTGDEWERMRAKFTCPHGVTNVWERTALKGAERIRVSDDDGTAAHLNQKPLDLMARIIRASSSERDVIWEPFGGLFTASIAAAKLDRQTYAAEIDPMYFTIGVSRARAEIENSRLI